MGGQREDCLILSELFKLEILVSVDKQIEYWRWGVEVAWNDSKEKVELIMIKNPYVSEFSKALWK